MVPVPMLEFSALETGKDETKMIYRRTDYQVSERIWIV